MAKLIFSMEGTFLDEFPLDKNRLTIGRRPNNDIHIDNLAVSGEHAVIITIGNDSFLEDIGSTNGTLVNGKIIKKHVLQHGDVVEFGKFQLKYVNDAAALQAANGGMDDFEKTMVIRPAAKAAVPTASPITISTAPMPITLPPITPTAPVAAPEMPAHTMSQPITIAPVKPEPATAEPLTLAETPVVEPISSISATPVVAASVPAVASLSTAPINHAATSASMVAQIQVLSGASAGKELILNKALTTLGKPGVQVAVITKRPQGYFITHVEGAVHPIVNGKSAGAQAHQLNDNDVIELAGVKMQFYLFKAS